MKKKVQHFISFVTVLTFIIIGIASAPSKESITEKSGQIAPTFPGTKDTLLIVKYTKDWVKYADKYFTINYKGPFLLIEEKDLKTKYSDAKIYPFVIKRNLEDHNSASATMKTTVEKLCMFDRKKEKAYCTGTTSFYGKLLNSYSQALEAARLETK